MDRHTQKDLLLKIEGLGKTMEYEDQSGNIILLYEKGLDCNGTRFIKIFFTQTARFCSKTLHSILHKR
jgi:hypothetical protein